MSLHQRILTGAVILLAMGVVRIDPAHAAAQEPEKRATLKVIASSRSPNPIPPFITGKFAEHLGSNIYNGMCAQVLRNPTFADFPFWTGGISPDGRTMFHSDEQKIADAVRHLCVRLGFSNEQIAQLIESRKDGLAFWWSRLGPKNAVRPSADAGPHGGRAQRIEVQAAGQGIEQWMYLPMHRARKYQYEIVVRSPDFASLTIRLAPDGKTGSQVPVDGITRKWQTLRGMIELDSSLDPNSLYQLSIAAPRAGQFVIERMLLWPADHIDGADPDVVRFLKQSRLPILRWPGGNFVSGYHWEDGIGPMNKRPTRPNWAWGGLEPNLFGTDEFIAFCRAVGCEPMICVNAGDGTPDEAARWIEYCNGPINTPMGAKRAANGHPEPFNVKYWEVGNEIWGSWQVHWTTPKGNVDRYREFAEAMRAADETIILYACGAPVLWGKDWNQTLIKGTAPIMQRTTDHPLIGGTVSPAAEPLDVYRSFMAVPDVLERKWTELRQWMLEAGIKDPRLAITELQLFAHIGGNPGDSPKLTQRNLVTPATHAEAIYNTLIYHTSIRLAPFVDMVTHSATVNHGGGLRKERERVYANPCHYAQAMFADFAGATPVAANLDSPTERVAMVLSDVKGTAAEVQYGTLATLAAIAKDGSLLISIVHRGTSGPVQLAIELQDFKPANRAGTITLSADVPWASNTLDNPDAVRPGDGSVDIIGGKLVIDIKPFTVMRVRIPAAQ
jgi:alpha-N-arabinofuranosidase